MAWTDRAAPPGQILLRGLVDDAGLFPPSPLSLFQALQRNRTDRILAHPVLSRRLLCPAGLLPELARRAREGGANAALDAAVEGEVDRELEDAAPALEALEARAASQGWSQREPDESPGPKEEPRRRIRRAEGTEHPTRAPECPEAPGEPQQAPDPSGASGPSEGTRSAAAPEVPDVPEPDLLRQWPGPLDVGVVLDGDGPTVPAQASGLPGLRVTHFEAWALPEEVRRVALLTRVGGAARLRTVYFEVPRGTRRLEAVAGLGGARPLGVRIRCHGTRAHPPPGVTELADFICECVVHDVPFRIAAGQHRAVSAPPVGGLPARHGYLNVLLATAAAVEGAGAGQVRQVLRTTDEELIAARFAAVGWRTAVRTRRVFTGVGARSTGEPPRDVERLGLLGAVGKGAA